MSRHSADNPREAIAQGSREVKQGNALQDVNAEQAFESLLTCSVVVAPYLVDGRPAGTIGVLGPTRMDYPQAMAAVTLVSEGLSERLHDG